MIASSTPVAGQKSTFAGVVTGTSMRMSKPDAAAATPGSTGRLQEGPITRNGNPGDSFEEVWRNLGGYEDRNASSTKEISSQTVQSPWERTGEKLPRAHAPVARLPIRTSQRIGNENSVASHRIMMRLPGRNSLPQEMSHSSKSRTAPSKSDRVPTKPRAAQVAGAGMSTAEIPGTITCAWVAAPQPSTGSRMPELRATPQWRESTGGFPAQSIETVTPVGSSGSDALKAVDHGGNESQNATGNPQEIDAAGLGRTGKASPATVAHRSAISSRAASPTTAVDFSPSGNTTRRASAGSTLKATEPAVSAPEPATGSKTANQRNLVFDPPPVQHIFNLPQQLPHVASFSAGDTAPAILIKTERPVSLSAGNSSPVRETLSALDAADRLPSPIWTHAGARQAEAGYQDEQLGWVAVRAQMGADGIHAAVLPDSAAAAQSLANHLAGLNAHLVEEHVPIAALTLSFGENTGTPMNGGGTQADQQGGEAFSRHAEVRPPAAPNADVRPFDRRESPELPRNLPGGGRYVSVMA